MFRTIALTATLALIAGSASAQDIRVKIDGKNDAAVQQDIRVAAHRVCAKHNEGVFGLQPMAVCVSYVVRDAEGQVAQVRAAMLPGNLKLASK